MTSCQHSYRISRVRQAQWASIGFRFEEDAIGEGSPPVEIKELEITFYCRLCGRIEQRRPVIGAYHSKSGRLLLASLSSEEDPDDSCVSEHDFEEAFMLTPERGSNRLILVCRRCLKVALPEV